MRLQRYTFSMNPQRIPSFFIFFMRITSILSVILIFFEIPKTYYFQRNCNFAQLLKQ